MTYNKKNFQYLTLNFQDQNQFSGKLFESISIYKYRITIIILYIYIIL